MRGLYAHIPFCVNKCGYCGFYSECGHTELYESYFDSLGKELNALKDKKYDTIYIGGGTPSCVPPFFLSKFIEQTDMSAFTESTIECNPESVTDDFLGMVHDAGFSRISMGCQSTDDGVLKLLGRIHSAADVYNAYDRIRRLCPDTDINLDMIFDIPSSDNEKAVKTLNDIIAMGPEHVSAYSYSFDTGYLADKKQHKDSLYMPVKRRLAESGYCKYEISNFAKKGHESKHNINYWLLGDYDGIGASAWSLENCSDRRVLRGKTQNIKNYICSPFDFESEDVSGIMEMFFEDMVFGLRMLDGVDFLRLNNRYGTDICSILNEPLCRLCEEGMLVWDQNIIKITEKGELLLDSVQEFLWGFLP